MTKREHLSSSHNNLSLTPREIDLPYDEKKVLFDITKNRVTDIFRESEHTTTYQTRTAIQLEASPLSSPGDLFTLLVKTPYSRAHIQATFAGPDSSSKIDLAQIKLFEPNTPYTCELMVTELDDGLDDDFDPNLPAHVFAYKDTSIKSSAEYTPLRASDANTLLNGLVTQADPYTAITKPVRSIGENVRALLATSPDVSIEKSLDYESETGTIVNVRQYSSRTQINAAETSEGYRVAVTETTPEEGYCLTTTECILNTQPDAIATSIALNYASPESSDDSHEEKMRRDLVDFNTNSEVYPGRFATQILEGLETMYSQIKIDPAQGE